MAEKRKKTGREGSGNLPFHGLAGLVKEAGISLQARDEPAAAPIPVRRRELPPAGQSDEELFQDAMQGVAPCHWRNPTAPGGKPAPASPMDTESADQLLWQEAAAASAPPPILDHPEYIEGWVGVAGRRFLPGLRNGIYSIQAAIDLHGLDRIEARQAVEDFIIRMSHGRSCCVKIIHGRGINSPKDSAVLKESLQDWLTTRRMAHHVVAYASAPYADGGVGAAYILVRKSRRPAPARADRRAPGSKDV